jgi:hypothetical protein
MVPRQTSDTCKVLWSRYLLCILPPPCWSGHGDLPPASEHGFALGRANATTVEHGLTGIVKPHQGLTMYNYQLYGIDF